jgi:hypothetical protein
MNLATWLFGAREVKAIDRKAAAEIFVQDTLNLEAIEETRNKAIANNTNEVYKQEIGFIYDGPVTVSIEFKKSGAVMDSGQ